MIGVTGANGALGQRVVQALVEEGETSLVLGTRSGSVKNQPAGTTARTVNFTAQNEMTSSFAGIDDLLIISTGAPVDERIQQHINAIAAATEAGVRRILYTSFIDHTRDSPFPFATVHAATEEALQESGVPFLILRNGQYADRFIEFAPSAKATGDLRLPVAPGAGSSFISRDDLAAFAARALRTPELTGTLTPTGAEAVSYAHATAELSNALGTQIDFVECSREEYTDSLLAEGWPEWEVEAFAQFFQAIEQGLTSAVTTDFVSLMDREPVPLAQLFAHSV